MNQTNGTSCLFLMIVLNGYPHIDIFAVLILSMSPVIIILNTVLIVALIATKEVRQNTSSFLILCLSASDLFMGVVCLPILAYLLLNKHNEASCTLTSAIQILSGCFASFSCLLTLLIAVDRYHHMNPNYMNRPSIIKNLFKIKNVIYLVALMFILTLSLSIAVQQGGLNPRSMAITGLCYACGSLIYIIAVACLYVRGYTRISSFTEENPVYQETTACGEQPQYVKNLYKTVLLLLILYCVTYIPFFTIQLLVTISIIAEGSYDPTTYGNLNEIVQLLVFSSGITNSILVFHRNKNIKRWLFDKSRLCKRTRDTVSQRSHAVVDVGSNPA